MNNDSQASKVSLSSVDFRLSLGTFLLLLLLSELLLAWRGPAWAAFQKGLPLHSRGLVEDRLRGAAGRGPLLLLGDSVLFGTALREHGVGDWQERTPAAFLQAQVASTPVLNLSDEGLYPEDLLALASAAQGLRPRAVVLELNYRMLSEEAGKPASALTRAFLKESLPAAFREEGASPAAGMEGLSAWLEERWRLLRYVGACSERGLPGGTRRLFSGWVAAAFPQQEGVDPEMLLDLKIRPYYGAPAVEPGHRGLRALEALAGLLSRQGVPVLVFLTPQNLPRVSGLLDPAAFKRNRAALAGCFRRPGLEYRDWSSLAPGGAFLDHCHLDAAGNQALAARIARELKL